MGPLKFAWKMNTWGGGGGGRGKSTKVIRGGGGGGGGGVNAKVIKSY